MTVLDHVGRATAQLVEAGLPPDVAAFDAELLARHVLGWDRAAFVSNRRSDAPSTFPAEYSSMLERRAQREPVSLILGHREFWGLDFEVGRSVLTPRPETELLVEETLRAAGDLGRTSLHLVDVGTGSGCVSVALALELEEARLTAVDVSAAALAVARRNAERHGVSNRITWVHGAYLDGVDGAPDVIVTNPPYVPDSDADSLPPEVKFEPRIALMGGADGLDTVRGVLDASADRLAPSGYLIMEFGMGQVAAIRESVDAHPRLSLTRVRTDLQDIPRTAVIQRH